MLHLISDLSFWVILIASLIKNVLNHLKHPFLVYFYSPLEIMSEEFGIFVKGRMYIKAMNVAE